MDTIDINAYSIFFFFSFIFLLFLFFLDSSVIAITYQVLLAGQQLTAISIK